LAGLIFPLDSVSGKSVQAGGLQAGFAGFADGLAAALVFIVGGDVADAGVQPDRVVVPPDGSQLGSQGGRVGDGEQMRVLGSDPRTASTVSAAITPRGDGGSRIHVIWNRTPTSMVGRLATVLIQLTGGKPVATSIRKALAKLERHPRPDR
jgi:hypothetical protein